MVAYGRNHADVKTAVDGFLAQTGLGLDQMYSTAGRIAARALETQVIAQAMGGWLDSASRRRQRPRALDDAGRRRRLRSERGPPGRPGTLDPDPERRHRQLPDGDPLHLELRPALRRRQTRTRGGRPGGHPVADPRRPVEILRTVRSFDPCIACAVHVIDPRENKTYLVRAM